MHGGEPMTDEYGSSSNMDQQMEPGDRRESAGEEVMAEPGEADE